MTRRCNRAELASWIAVTATRTLPMKRPGATSAAVTAALSAMRSRLAKAASATREGEGEIKVGSPVIQITPCQSKWAKAQVHCPTGKVTSIGPNNRAIDALGPAHVDRWGLHHAPRNPMSQNATSSRVAVEKRRCNCPHRAAFPGSAPKRRAMATSIICPTDTMTF